jgi:hypothetical protein
MTEIEWLTGTDEEVIPMTEIEWLTGTDPVRMLEHIWDRATERKLRLLAVATLRSGLDSASDVSHLKALRLAELLADGEGNSRAIEVLIERLQMAMEHCVADQEFEAATSHRSCRDALQPKEPWSAARSYVIRSQENLEGSSPSGPVSWVLPRPLGSAHKLTCQCIREVLGNPFRARDLDALVLHWNDRTVLRLAQAIYDERAFDRMPILGDALEDAGCTDAAILEHCRAPEPHVRGCWVVDTILGKS